MNREKDPTQFAQPIFLDVPVVIRTMRDDVRPFVVIKGYKGSGANDVAEKIGEAKDKQKELRRSIKAIRKETNAM